MTCLYIVVPCYNEQEVLSDSSQKLKAKLFDLMDKKIISENSKIMFVDDGSKDNTWNMISELCSNDNSFTALKLSRNKGHQNALYAGLMKARELCDAAISIDADLQDSIEVMDEFVEKYHGGCDIVFGVRDSRETDSFLKRFTATSYYKILNALGCDIVYNHADYRLMSRRALDALSEYKEINLFLRGIAKDIGFKTDTVYYDRAERLAGESKYTLSKMLRLAGDGITSFSTKPLNMIFVFSFISLLTGFGLFITSIVLAILGESAMSFVILASIWSACGIQLFAAWIIGKYVGKAYFETKARPKYIISDEIINQENRK